MEKFCPGIRRICEERKETADVQKDKIKREPKAAVMERTERESEIIRFAAALANIYGVYTLMQLKDVWDYNHDWNISPAELLKVLEKAGEEDGLYMDSDVIVNTMLEDREACFKIVGSYGTGDTYCFPGADVVSQYEGSLNMDEAAEYTYLRSYLLRKTEEEKIDEIFKVIHFMAMNDEGPEALLSYIAEAGIAFDDEADKEKFLSLYIEWFYNLRVWVCKGYRPAELKPEKMAYRNFRLPEGTDTVKRAKPGRNDACPCGSGKKFKNCCLKQINE